MRAELLMYHMVIGSDPILKERIPVWIHSLGHDVLKKRIGFLGDKTEYWRRTDSPLPATLWMITSVKGRGKCANLKGNFLLSENFKDVNWG